MLRLGKAGAEIIVRNCALSCEGELSCKLVGTRIS